MRNLKNTKKMLALRLVFGLSLFGGLFLGSVLTAQAQTTTFASFNQIGAARPFVFTNNSPTASGTFNTASGGASVRFFYDETVIAGLDVSLQGQQNATLTMTSSTTIPATNTGGNLDQPIQTITIAIIRNTAAPVGSGTRRNLLTVTVTTGLPSLGGTVNGGSASLSASTPGQNVVFSSDFLSFNATTARDFGISLTGGSPVLTLGANSFLSTSGLNGGGSFASNPVPTVPTVATAASVTVGGRVLTASGRGLRNAQVTVTQADGSTRTVLTGVNGAYSFADLIVPQTVVLSVRSKTGYQYTPQVIGLNSDLTGVNFIPDEK